MKSEDTDQPDHTLAAVTATPAGRWSALAGQSTRLHRRADIPSPSRKRSWNRCLPGAGAPPAIARTAAPWINALRFDLRQATDRHGHAARAPETHLLLRQLRPCG